MSMTYSSIPKCDLCGEDIVQGVGGKPNAWQKDGDKYTHNSCLNDHIKYAEILSEPKVGGDGIAKCPQCGVELPADEYMLDHAGEGCPEYRNSPEALKRYGKSIERKHK